MEDLKEAFLKASNYAFNVVLIKEDKQLHLPIYYVSNCFMTRQGTRSWKRYYLLQ